MQVHARHGGTKPSGLDLDYPPLGVGGGGPLVTFRLVVVSLRGPRQSPALPFACCVGSLLSVGRCGRCSCWCRFRVHGAQGGGGVTPCGTWVNPPPGQGAQSMPNQCLPDGKCQAQRHS